MIDRPEEKKPEGAPEWMVTYSDMMSLLLCFFIMLAAFSRLKTEHREDQMIEAMILQFGSTEHLERWKQGKAKEQEVTPGQTENINEPDPSNPEKSDSGESGPPGMKTPVEITRVGNRVIIGGPMLFEPGSAILLENAKRAFDDVSKQLKVKRGIIEIRGFAPPNRARKETDRDADINRLAFQRTRAVKDYLVIRKEIVAARFRIALAAPVEIEKFKVGEKELERIELSVIEQSNWAGVHGYVPTEQ